MFLIYVKTQFDQVSTRLAQLSHAERPSPPASFLFKEATAFVLGHRDLREFRRAVSKAKCLHEPPSEWDEHCGHEQLTERRLGQAERLAEYAKHHGWALADALAFIQRWQPTAERPKSEALDKDSISQLRADGEAERVQGLLDQIRADDRIPTSDEIRQIRIGLKCATGKAREWMETDVGMLGVRLVNERVGLAASMGMDLLEALNEETSMPFVDVSIAKALFQAWGTERKDGRARRLCDRVWERLQAGDVFTSDAGRLEYFWVAGCIYFESDRAGDALRAYECLRRAADLGHGKAALRVCWYLSPPHPDAGEDQYTGLVPVDEAAAMQYFLIALREGYDPDTKSFPGEA